MLQTMMHPLHLYDAYLGVVESTMFIAEDIEESNSQVARHKLLASGRSDRYWVCDECHPQLFLAWDFRTIW